MSITSLFDHDCLSWLIFHFSFTVLGETDNYPSCSTATDSQLETPKAIDEETNKPKKKKKRRK